MYKQYFTVVAAQGGANLNYFICSSVVYYSGSYSRGWIHFLDFSLIFDFFGENWRFFLLWVPKNIKHVRSLKGKCVVGGTANNSWTSETMRPQPETF